jgi:hypothetical protein
MVGGGNNGGAGTGGKGKPSGEKGAPNDDDGDAAGAVTPPSLGPCIDKPIISAHGV